MSSHPGDPPDFNGEPFDVMSPLGWVASVDGRVKRFNKAWYAYTGKTPEQMIGHAWEAAHDPAVLPTVLDRWRECIADGQPRSMHVLLKGRDGAFRWFVSDVAAVRDAHGKIASWIGTYTDVDELKRREATLESAVTKREELLAMVSHDLRNPLSTVLMAAKQIELFAADPKAVPRNVKAAQAVVRAVNQMTRLVGDLLDLARLAAEQPLGMELDHVDVVELAEHAVEASRPIAKVRKLTLDTRLPPRPVRAMCDGDRLLQVLDNLIGNAIKFTPEGGLIGLDLRQENDEVVFSVSDTGTGIKQEELPLIFEPYWQADQQRRRGAGLGLAIVKAIVEAQNGRVWVETELGRGTTFHFTLPAIKTPPAEKEDR